MSDIAKTLPIYSDAERLRDKLFDDLATVPTFAKAIRKAPRSVLRLSKEGLPVTYIGKTPYVVISKAMEFLAKPKATPAPVRRGRPRKTASN